MFQYDTTAFTPVPLERVGSGASPLSHEVAGLDGLVADARAARRHAQEFRKAVARFAEIDMARVLGSLRDITGADVFKVKD